MQNSHRRLAGALHAGTCNIVCRSPALQLQALEGWIASGGIPVNVKASFHNAANCQ